MMPASLLGFERLAEEQRRQEKVTQGSNLAAGRSDAGAPWMIQAFPPQLAACWKIKRSASQEFQILECLNEYRLWRGFLQFSFQSI